MARRGAPRQLQHELLKVLDRRELTVSGEFGSHKGQVYDWISGRRPVPAAWARLMRKKYGVPLSAWPRISE